ncbi:MAG: hypothetical protein AAF513_08690 [Pseudomonadota bacterium]
MTIFTTLCDIMTRQTLAIALLIPFLILTAYAVYDVGFIGIFEYQMLSSGGWQVFADLAIALILLWSFLVPHARDHGRNPWPWIVATAFVGVISPLVYLATTATSTATAPAEQT